MLKSWMPSNARNTPAGVYTSMKIFLQVWIARITPQATMESIKKSGTGPSLSPEEPGTPFFIVFSDITHHFMNDSNAY